MSKFLVKNDPGKFVGPTAPDGTTLQDSALGSETVEGMNKQYSIMKYVQSYTVITVPANRTGTVNLRWGPSKNTNLVAKVPADYELTVLAESKNWLLVNDPLTGKISYVARKFTNARSWTRDGQNRANKKNGSPLLRRTDGNGRQLFNYAGDFHK
jgi:hypothetical protein